jgi:SAM-dependent methyltransferase
MTHLYELPEIYDALFHGDAGLSHYLELARQHPGDVLELACGTGRLTVPLAESGVSVVGLDRSSTMLETAGARAKANGAEVEFVQGDMRTFDLGRTFSLIFVTSNSLLHLTSTADLLATFESVRRHLMPDGIFAFDVFNPDLRILARPRGERFPVASVVTEAHGTVVVEETHDYNTATQVNHGAWFISTAEKRDAWVVPMVLRSIFPEELTLLVSAAGFELIERFGGFSGEPFSAESPRQLCVCRVAG